MRYPVPTSYRDWHGYEEEEPTEWRQFGTSSQLCFLEWLHLEFSCMKTFERVLLCIFSLHLMFFIIDNQRGILSSVFLAASHDALSRANIIPRLARISRRRTDRMTSFRYLIAVKFPWMVTLGVYVCTKYPYPFSPSRLEHILYRDQLEIRISVHGLLLVLL